MPLIEGLEATKKTAADIAAQAQEAQATQAQISKAREVYRPVAVRGSLLYFLVDSLSALDRVYHYSMANFVRIMGKAMVRRVVGDEEGQGSSSAAAGSLQRSPGAC